MLTPIGPDIWESVQPLRVAGFELGHRMTLIRSGGKLFIHSPVALDSTLTSEIEKIGPVEAIIAPSKMHDLYLKEWANHFQSARLLHSPALKIKDVAPA